MTSTVPDSTRESIGESAMKKLTEYYRKSHAALGISFLTAAFLAFSTDAYGDCQPDGEDWYLNRTITCTGVDSDGWVGTSSWTIIIILDGATAPYIVVSNLQSDPPTPIGGGGNEVYNFGTVSHITVGPDNYVENNGAAEQIKGYGWSTLINDVGGSVSNSNSNNYGIFGSSLLYTLGDPEVAVYYGTDVINRGSITMTGTTSTSGMHIERNGLGVNESTGYIITTGDDSAGMLGTEAVELQNLGSITVQGAISDGMFVVGDAIMNNSGAIIADGDGSGGIDLIGRAGQITNSGSINVTGIGNYGISALFAPVGTSGATTLSITNDGSIHATGSTTYGISVDGYDGAVIDNNASVEVNGDNAQAISVGGTASIVNNSATGTVTATGDGAYAIALGGAGQVINHGLILAEGVAAIGIAAEGDDITLINAETARVDVTEIDSIGMGVRGNNAILHNDGIVATQSSRSPAIGVEGDSATIITGPDSGVQTAGAESPGVAVRGSVLDITNGGLIATQNDLSPGIYVEGDSVVPNLLRDITNTGDISTMGNSSPGIDALGAGHNVYNEILSFITTVGADSPAIKLGSSAAPRVNSEVVNAGGISTGSLGSTSHGVSIFGDDARFTNADTGSILTNGVGAHGVAIQGENAVVSIDGTIRTIGPDALGLSVSGESNTASSINITGSIVTQGNRGHGVQLNGDNYQIQVAGTGSIETSGDDAIGLKVGDPGSLPILSATVTSLGTIETAGENAHGIMLFAEPGAVGNGTSRTLVTGGSITTQRDGAAGIVVTGSDWWVTNNAKITTGSAMGGVGAYGIAMLSSDSMLVNKASIDTSGTSAHGLHAEGDGIVVANSGAITTTGPTSYGVHVVGNIVDIQNLSTITVTNIGSVGVYLETQSGHHSGLINGDTGSITNTRPLPGSLYGVAVQGGDGSDHVDNSGTINGAVMLGNGPDQLTIKGKSEINGIADGGVSAGDTDTLVVEPAADDPVIHLTGDSLVNFEQFTKQGNGTAFLNGTLTVDQASIEAGVLQVQPSGVLDADHIEIRGSVPGDRCYVSTCVMLNGGELRYSSSVVVGQGGSVLGTGSFDAPPHWPFTVDGGWIGPGFSTGTLEFSSDFELISGILELEADSLQDTDKLFIGGDFNIESGLIEVMLGFAPYEGDVLDFFTISGTTNIPAGYNPIVGIAAAGSGVPLGTPFTVDIGGELFSGVVTSVVPIPTAVWLFGSGLLGLVAVARRRRFVS